MINRWVYRQCYALTVAQNRLLKVLFIVYNELSICYNQSIKDESLLVGCRKINRPWRLGQDQVHPALRSLAEGGRNQHPHRPIVEASLQAVSPDQEL